MWYVRTFKKNVEKFKKLRENVISGNLIDSKNIREEYEKIDKTFISLNSDDHAFFGEVLKVYYDESMLDEKGAPDILLADVLAYGTGKYYSLKESIDTYGFSKRK